MARSWHGPLRCHHAILAAAAMAFESAAIWGAVAGAAAGIGAAVPGGGGARGAGAGRGGYSGEASARERAGGGEGAYGGEGGRDGGGYRGPGAAVHLNIYGNVATDMNSTQELFDQWGQAVKNGTLLVTASRSVVAGPTARGRG